MKAPPPTSLANIYSISSLKINHQILLLWGDKLLWRICTTASQQSSQSIEHSLGLDGKRTENLTTLMVNVMFSLPWFLADASCWMDLFFSDSSSWGQCTKNETLMIGSAKVCDFSRFYCISSLSRCMFFVIQNSKVYGTRLSLLLPVHVE